MDATSGLTERQVAILRRLSERGFASTAELARWLSVSDMTIRRDTRELALRGVVRQVHGGVAPVDGGVHPAGFAERARADADAKRRIAELCCRLVGPDETLLLDAGTTVFEIARRLPSTFSGTIVTHSVPVIQHALQLHRARTICLGGELLSESQAFIGAITVEAIRGLRARTAFIGVAGVRTDGLYIDSNLELPTKHALVASADRVLVVATAGKMNLSAMVHLGGFDGVSGIVTDAPVPDGLASVLSARGVDVLVADPGAQDA